MKKVIAKKDSLVNVDWSGRMEVYSSSDYLPVRALAHRVKDGDKESWLVWEKPSLNTRKESLYQCQEEAV